MNSNRLLVQGLREGLTIAFPYQEMEITLT